MTTNEVQYRNTKAHLRQFEEALQNLEAASPEGTRGKLAQLEIDAVRAQADDLRAELEEYERLRSGQVFAFEASSGRIACASTNLLPVDLASTPLQTTRTTRSRL